MPHRGSDLLSHIGLETMDGALGTSRLTFLERAFLKTLLGIDQELITISAWFVASMFAATVEIYHDCDGLAFPGYSGMTFIHGKYILTQGAAPKLRNRAALPLLMSRLKQAHHDFAHESCATQIRGLSSAWFQGWRQRHGRDRLRLIVGFFPTGPRYRAGMTL